MKALPVLALAFALSFGAVTALHAEDAPPDKKPAKAAAKGPRLVQPWSKMDSLTPEQKTQIAAIHKAAVADKKKIEEKEDADITALLTPEQKTEVAKIKEESGAAAKRKGKGDATTQPADAM